ncbi:MAG: type II toxin-antitoxin system RelE/ParE family toxin [Candidatus Yonathbacteria bacterium]|nr:type II toxin-antitoxin system RelE/ParE family toxin [Candidatus Yonathbacteria bacterium]
MEQDVIFLDVVSVFIQKLPSAIQAKVAANVAMLCAGDFASVYVKQLDGPICELIVKQYRFIFFRKGTMIYMVGAFRKKSTKTPMREIKHAVDIFKNI